MMVVKTHHQFYCKLLVKLYKTINWTPANTNTLKIIYDVSCSF
jgi:hypothetical protein